MLQKQRLKDPRARIVGGREGRVVPDLAANAAAVGSPAEVWVVPTNEELVIALDAVRLAQSPAAGR